MRTHATLSGAVLLIAACSDAVPDVERSTYTHTVTSFDEDGVVIETGYTTYDLEYRPIAGGGVLGDGTLVETWRFHYEGDCLTEEVYDGVTTVVRECDHNGDPLTETTDAGTRTYVREYDTNGCSVRVQSIDPDYGPYVETLEWDEAGRRVAGTWRVQRSRVRD